MEAKDLILKINEFRATVVEIGTDVMSLTSTIHDVSDYESINLGSSLIDTKNHFTEIITDLKDLETKTLLLLIEIFSNLDLFEEVMADANPPEESEESDD